MKSPLAIFLSLLCLSALTTAAQEPTAADSVPDRGPHHTVLELPGVTGSPPRRVTVLENGANYLADDGWRKSEPRFEQVPQGYLASRIQHRVRIAADLFQRGAVAMRTPSGIDLYSTPLAVTLRHGTNMVVIGSITNSTGILLDPSHVYFDRPFGPDLCCGIVFSVEAASFEQSVYFFGRLDPRDYGIPLDQFTVLSVWTEFYQTNQPQAQRTLTDPLTGDTDDTLNFGDDFAIAGGYAFTIPTPAETNGAWAPVRKQYKVVDGRTFLVESFPVISIARGLLSLPDCSDQTPEGADLRSQKASALYAALPPAPPAAPKTAKKAGPMLLASADILRRPAVVADYRAALYGQSIGLRSDVTYLVNGNVTCTNLSVNQNTVVKFKTNSAITVLGPITCNAAKMRPAWFTSIDDDSVGESMAGFDSSYSGTINPAGYANPALSGNTAFTLNYCRFAYAQLAVADCGSPGDMTVTLNHCQFTKCINGIRLTAYTAWNKAIKANNVLMAQVTYPFYEPESTMLPYSSYTLANCTVDRADQLIPYAYPHLWAYNCIFANITNATAATNETLNGSNNAFYNTPQTFGDTQFQLSESPFQSAGGGAYYLADSSSLRNKGTSSGPPGSLLVDLQQMTTYPPVVAGPAVWTNNVTLSPQVQLDLDAPDLGVHYPPADFLLGGITVTNCTVAVTPGTVIGTFATNGFNYGLYLASGGSLQSTGRPNNPNWLLPYNLIQEQTPPGWLQPTNGSLLSEAQGGSTINCRFTRFSSPAQAIYHFNAPTNSGPFNFQDCEFYSGLLRSAGPTINLTNCLFYFVNTDIQPKDGLWTYTCNCLIFGGTFGIGPSNSVIADNLFYGAVTIPNWIGARGNTYTGYNAYQSSGSRLQPPKAGDKTSFSPILAFDVGPLGNYYQRSSNKTLNAGGTTADLVGLYHYTSCTNLSGGYQIKETNSVVDMGYHYPATDAAGNPIDTDGDGLADYFENTSGTGSFATGDISNWQSADTDGDGVSDGLEVIQGRSPRVSQTTPDTTGVINLRVFTPLK